jgi:hypothetical protein
MKQAKVYNSNLSTLRYKIFKYIDFFETYMRNFIEKELKAFYGNEWLQKGVPGDIRERWNEHKEFWVEHGFPPESDINYADLRDYVEILSLNWDNIFKTHFIGKKYSDIRTYFWGLKIRRDLAYHASLHINDHDVRLVESFIKELLTSEEAKKEFDKVINGELLTNTEIKIMGPLIFQLNGVSSAEELAKLTDLPLHIVKMILRESFVRMGLMSVATGAEISSGIIAGAPILEEEGRFKPYEEIYFLTLPIKEVLRKFPELKTKARNYDR